MRFCENSEVKSGFYAELIFLEKQIEIIWFDLIKEVLKPFLVSP